MDESDCGGLSAGQVGWISLDKCGPLAVVHGADQRLVCGMEVHGEPLHGDIAIFCFAIVWSACLCLCVCVFRAKGEG